MAAPEAINEQREPDSALDLVTAKTIGEQLVAVVTERIKNVAIEACDWVRVARQLPDDLAVFYGSIFNRNPNRGATFQNSGERSKRRRR